jgi:hypothetical protein
MLINEMIRHDLRRLLLTHTEAHGVLGLQFADLGSLVFILVLGIFIGRFFALIFIQIKI